MFKYTINKDLPKNLSLLIKQRKNEIPDYILQASKDSSGKFCFYTYRQVYEEIVCLANALSEIGIKRSSNVAIISDNRREWFLTDGAILALGAVDVPRGCDSMGTEIRFIISFADCEYGFFENGRQLKKVLEKSKDVPLLKTVILFDKISDEEKLAAEGKGLTVYYFWDFLNDAKKRYAENKQEITQKIEAEMDKTEADDVATMIFTSGTTGTPKGVMLTHKNYMTQMSVIHNFVSCKPGDCWMSILPVWHSFERLIQYVAPTMKCYLAYSKPVASVLLADMAVIKPQWICGVPRLWEALAIGVDRAMKKTGGITLKIFNFFISVGKKYSWAKNHVLGRIAQMEKRCRVLDSIVGIIPFILLWPLHKLGDILVFKKIRAKFGGRITIAISGGGALQKDIDDFYRAIGLNLLEGYGMTETAPVISFRNPKCPRPGVVGVIFPTFELKIVEEKYGVIQSMEPLKAGQKGMIVVKGDQIMKGYYKRPDLTEKIIDKDGWLNTGDLGMVTHDGELKITGRAKDTIVLLGGENIEPSVIEAELLTSEYIESAMIVGQDQKYLAALIVPNKDNCLAFAKEHDIECDYEEILQTEQVQALFNTEINNKISLANGFRLCEKIYKFALIPNSFTVGDELSAKQEMIRFKISEKYADVIKELF